MNTASPATHDEARIPLKVNIFEQVLGASAALTPVFPSYLGPGCIVPCSAAFESTGSATHLGYFMHENTVDEIGLAIASNGRLRTGDVFVGPKLHGVGESSTEPFSVIFVITQRQLEEGQQAEAWILPCEKCKEVVYRYDFDERISGDGQYKGLPTILGSDGGVQALNESEQLRTCKACGHVNRPFPGSYWGFDTYARRNRIVQYASKAILEAAR